MPLGIDATLLYEQGSWTHKLTVSELAAAHAVQHAREPAACRRRRSATPGSRRCRRRRTRRTSTTSTTSPRVTAATTTSRTTTRTSWRMPGEPAIRGTTRLAGVVGWPVEHSRSPQMHNAAYAALGMDWAYVPLAVPPERLAEASAGPAGARVRRASTSPSLTSRRSPGCATSCPDAARDAGSVNTVLVRDDGPLRGETTDGDGMLDAIGDAAARARCGARRRRLGAVGGRGAARRRAPTSPCPRGAGGGGGRAGRARLVPWPLREPAGLIVNATPVAQSGDAAELPLEPAALDGTAVVCDLVYRADGARDGAARRGANGAARGRWTGWRCWSARAPARSACSPAPSRRST